MNIKIPTTPPPIHPSRHYRWDLWKIHFSSAGVGGGGGGRRGGGGRVWGGSYIGYRGFVRGVWSKEEASEWITDYPLKEKAHDGGSDPCLLFSRPIITYKLVLWNLFPLLPTLVGGAGGVLHIPPDGIICPRVMVYIPYNQPFVSYNGIPIQISSIANKTPSVFKHW